MTGTPSRPVGDAAKRLFDIIVSAAALVALSPALAIVALLVRTRLGSPVLFRQVRPGLNGRPFEMIKFRTMRDATGPDGHPLSDGERLTPFGAKLRSTSLDELPELWNVLKGEMSLVGPRPLLTKYLPFYSYEERRRHSVRPGVTGWAQVNGRNASPWDERFAADIWYVDNRSMALDLRVIASTVMRIVHRDGVVADPRSAMQDLDVERRDRLVFRRLDPEELQAAGALFQRAYDPALFEHTIIASPHFAAFFGEVVGRSGEVVGAFRDGRLVGVFEARRTDDDLYLNNFAVAPEEQGWGLASLLLDEFHSLAGGRPTRLHVDSRNAGAHRFYLRRGYREVEATPMTTLDVPDGPKGDGPAATVEDEAQLARYGVGHLRPAGASARFGLIGRDHLVAPPGTSEADLETACSLPGISRLTVTAGAEDLLRPARVVASWKRIEMVRG